MTNRNRTAKFPHRIIVRVDSSTNDLIEQYSAITGTDTSTTIRKFLELGGTMAVLDLYSGDEDQSS